MLKHDCGFCGGRGGGIRYDGHRKRPQSMPQTELRSEKISRRRWTIALLLGIGVLVNYFDRVNLSVSRDALEASFGISAVMFGWLSGAYNWTYMLLQLPSGLLLDRFGDRKSTRLNSSHSQISYAVFCLKKKKITRQILPSVSCHVWEGRSRFSMY